MRACVCACTHAHAHAHTHTHTHTHYTHPNFFTSAVKSFCHSDSPSSLVFVLSISPSCLAVWSVSPLVPTSRVTSVQLLHNATGKKEHTHMLQLIAHAFEHCVFV